MTESYYDLLGVAPDASTEEIERAYRERLKRTHPDVSDAEDAADRTRRLIRAREVLTDSVERDRYDRLGHAGYVGGGAVGEEPTADGPATTPDRGTDGRTAGAKRAGTSGTAGSPAASGVDRDAGSTAGVARNADRYQSGGWSGNRRRSEPRNAYATRETGLHRSRLADSQSLVLLSATFLLYPVLLWGVAFPAFPVAVNVALAACAIGVVAFLQSMPEVGTAVFAVWSALAVPAIPVLGVAPVSLTAAVAVLGTVLPLGLCLLTRRVVRP
jgi:hypothetical protein